jgi:beta-lactamase regulating signal transducer with metallopeptidase domain
MDKIILVLWLITISLLIFISFLLLKIVRKLYKKEIKEKEKERIEMKERLNREKERRKNCYNLNFLERIIFHTNFIPGFELTRIATEEEID